MSAYEAPALDAMAFQLASALEQYDRDAARMVETWLDMEMYEQVSEEIEQIRMFCAPLPQLSVPWAELLIAHAELVHSLWRLRFRELESDRVQLAEVRARHGACIGALRARCLRMLACSDSRPR
ncbi:MAG TPA: hypothetical protein VFM98_21440 [Ramlibacter sp.]|uniref:hypothetical protein n=1 Tax=Ramlibacter sp. TaxID=1917967 RepID=UPI002D7FCC5A|nr:hypothetical protein [Ramlibacter sp.]HET8748176.1 hypothetical protein [Ramlibacter sp.]